MGVLRYNIFEISEHKNHNNIKLSKYVIANKFYQLLVHFQEMHQQSPILNEHL